MNIEPTYAKASAGRHRMTHWQWQALPIMALALLLSACSSSGPVRPVDPELYRTAKSARTAFDLGEYEQAARLYRRSLNRARAMDDAVEIGNNAYNLAACSMELSEYAQAWELLEESRAAFHRTGEVPEGLSILEIKSALAGGNLENAEELMESISGVDSFSPEIRIQYKLLKADLALRLDESDKARLELSGLRDELREVGSDALNAEADRLEGKLLLRGGEFMAAGVLFDHRSDLLRKTAHYRPMAIALGRAGEAYWDGRAYCKSLDRFFRSARSLYAQEDMAESLNMLSFAMEVARDCDQESLRQNVRDLFEEIRGTMEGLPTKINE